MIDESAHEQAKTANKQTVGKPAVVTTLPSEEAPATGGHLVFQNLGRQLTDDDLANPAVTKLILDMLQESESDCEVYRGYVTRFHDSDKRAAVLQEKLHTQNAIEVAFGVGVGLGGAILGLAPLFWSDPPLGYIALIIGGSLIVGGTVVRVLKG